MSTVPSPLDARALPTLGLERRIAVLLVDDQAIVAEGVRRMLAEESDIDFHYCSDPAYAINAAIEVNATIVLQDLVMPDIDGLTLLKFLRANDSTRQIPVIVLSTKEDPCIKSDAFANGATDYLVKPPDKIELIARIRAHSRGYLSQLERDAAFQALRETQAELEKSNAQLQRLSLLDGLTGIANRRKFDETLDREWARAKRNHGEIALVMIDIDYFKAFNDHYGHQRGDECLKTVANTINGLATRATDLVARYGGEEFGVVLPDTPLGGARQLAEEMLAAVARANVRHDASGAAPHITISGGVAAAVPRKGEGPERLLTRADDALYAAKKAGRNCVHVAD